MPTLAATSAIGFIFAARAISMSDLTSSRVSLLPKVVFLAGGRTAPPGPAEFPAPILVVQTPRASLGFSLKPNAALQLGRTVNACVGSLR